MLKLQVVPKVISAVTQVMSKDNKLVKLLSVAKISPAVNQVSQFSSFFLTPREDKKDKLN